MKTEGENDARLDLRRGGARERERHGEHRQWENYILVHLRDSLILNIISTSRGSRRI